MLQIQLHINILFHTCGRIYLQGWKRERHVNTSFFPINQFVRCCTVLNSCEKVNEKCSIKSRNSTDLWILNISIPRDMCNVIKIQPNAIFIEKVNLLLRNCWQMITNVSINKKRLLDILLRLKYVLFALNKKYDGINQQKQI